MTQANLAIFLASCSLLLFMPGPTNALMMASGAASGFRRSMPMALVALAGYTCAITVLLVIGTLAQGHGPYISLALKAIAALVMSIIAFKLWVSATPSSTVARNPGVGGVLSLTLLNPKAMILAFGIMQPMGDTAEIAVKCAILGALVMLSAICWIAFGAATKTRSAVPSALVARGASLIIAGFAVYFFVTVLWCDRPGSNGDFSHFDMSAARTCSPCGHAESRAHHLRTPRRIVDQIDLHLGHNEPVQRPLAHRIDEKLGRRTAPARRRHVDHHNAFDYADTIDQSDIDDTQTDFAIDHAAERMTDFASPLERSSIGFTRRLRASP